MWARLNDTCDRRLELGDIIVFDALPPPQPLVVAAAAIISSRKAATDSGENTCCDMVRRGARGGGGSTDSSGKADPVAPKPECGCHLFGVVQRSHCLCRKGLL
jgi:hypothetical protein